ncbi:hypothetical protein VDS34_18135 [Xanthomonas campestris pv. campestris]|jgi:hypothetical protein|uniref:hypothetical protein n=1 Tax=Xanthomonas campestris TaxID=339 RepID=UPI0025A1B398|nr:hypothetical protein [Xanthomonas campestris]MDM7672464.1 hypothetical protein [Xanthomonas campestris pv. campestris]MDM7685369.1 hypothetical protein [Xanthomonas campestris pv. campestris]MDM7693462.1 hypothetical protein [Xanthomonas campestris pv. campestris]MDM7697642.1 hypothetical protein [Xanthomonas campestris pv. campestris]MDM7756087.1 hypothetical protein [Xanthomonas campestris pv. campestris]
MDSFIASLITLLHALNGSDPFAVLVLLVLVFVLLLYLFVRMAFGVIERLARRENAK